MEVPCPLRRPVNATQSRIKPFDGFLPTQSVKWRTSHPVTQTFRIAPSSTSFSIWTRKNVISRSKDSVLREFVPRTLFPTSTKRRDHKNTKVNVSGHLNSKTTEVKVDDEVNEGTDSVNLVDASSGESIFADKADHPNHGQILKVDESTVASNDSERITEYKVSNDSWSFVEGHTTGNVHATELKGNVTATGDVTSSKPLIGGVEKEGYAFVKPKLKRDKKLREDALARLAEDSLKKGNKLFHYPEIVKSNQEVEIFYNRSFSSLKNEMNVMIKGGFNDWLWKPFILKLSKSHVNADWLSCKILVPREAYKIDFVFYDGANIYDNNGERDFCIMVEGGMVESEFENFMIEERNREKKELVRQKVESRKQTKEQAQLKSEKLAREANKARAIFEVAKGRGKAHELTKKAVTSVDGVWFIEPSKYGDNDPIRLYYNRSSGPLSCANDIWLHGGYDNWKEGPSFISKLFKSRNKDGDWWHTDFIVPDQAAVLDWVFADGPPKQAVVYDNNHNQDFHALVPQSVPKEQHWVNEEQRLYDALEVERLFKEKETKAKAEKTAKLKAETKERTLTRFWLSQKHVVYTEPSEIKAGRMVTLFYDPAHTVLNGKAEIWLRYSFNRWGHRSSLLSAQRMFPSGNGSHLQTTVKVPIDAYVMDFVFCEKEDGGLFDNKNGMDYHIPVYGGVKEEPPLHIVHIAVEMAPIAKVGGLADVVTSLSRAVQDMNHNVDIILPKYDCLDYSQVSDLEIQKSYFLSGTEVKIWKGVVEGLQVYFLEPQNGFFWTHSIYSGVNDAERFGFFCHAALEFIVQNSIRPDVIHCHDWSSAPVTWLYKEHYKNYGLNQASVIFTIHNLEFGPQLIGKAMAYADKSTTVSPTYAREISGNQVVSPHLDKFHGILNGIDPDIWDPFNDESIPVSYTSENVIEGKRAAKDALQEKLGLKREDLPLVGIVTRLTHQKGIHLIKHAIKRTLERNGQVVLLGSAPDPQIQNDFVNLANQLHSEHNEHVRLCLKYDEPLSHMIYAASDFILVPSIFEPCGLTQLIAMRYGSIPVVRKTGGLHDTVFDVDHDREKAESYGLEPNGFNFEGADGDGVNYALDRAITTFYNERNSIHSMFKRVMEQDWSWNRPALDYLELYYSAGK